MSQGDLEPLGTEDGWQQPIESLVELWESYEELKRNLHVKIVSENGWSWLLAWAQFGLTEVECFGTTTLAKDQLVEVQTLLQSKVLFKEVQTQADLFTTPTQIKKIVICIHLSSSSSLALYRELAVGLANFTQVQGGGCMISVGGSTHFTNQVQQSMGNLFSWRPIRHSKLGGLTTARLTLGWSGFGNRLQPGIHERPKRPLNRFLDPVAPNSTWRKAFPGRNDCWYPSEPGEKPYSWPWNKGTTWVQTTSVFFTHPIQRKFTLKERCQLMDLRPDWKNVLEAAWQWNEGGSPPLRMLIEFIIAIHPTQQEKREWIETESKIKSGIDWGRIRAPWLGQNNQTESEPNLDRMLYFGWTWGPIDAMEIAVACKGDDATVDLTLWAVGGNEPGMEEARTIIRRFLWRIWLRRICREGREWVQANFLSSTNKLGHQEDIDDCLQRCRGSDWWNWDAGSRLFYWRWPEIWREEARSGAIGYHTKYPRPCLRFPAVPLDEEWIIQKDKEKLEKLLRRGYIGEGKCLTTVPRFPVPKGDDDIRVVWDLAKNGMNETMFTPTFFLATMATYLRRVHVGFYGGDFDIGEQFHNYMLHESERPYCGVEVPEDLREKLAADGISSQKYMRWNRLVFGWQSSPYMALRMFARALEYAKGTPEELTSPFAFDKVILNLPGASEYNPALPRVMKTNTHGEIAAECVTFYDDGRVFATTEDKAIQALRQITSRLQFLGNQDAARKRRIVSQQPGAWAGGVVFSDQNLLRTFITQKKWDKTKAFLEWVWERLQSPEPTLERTKFRSGKGFLVHVSLCYEFMQPYMKGFHLSEDAWRNNRDSEGWKLRPSPKRKVEPSMDDDMLDLFDDEDVSDSLMTETIKPPTKTEAPSQVHPAPRLLEDVRILLEFFQPPTPVQVIVRPVEGASLVAYGAGDASGEGFGGQLQPLGEKAMVRRGFWKPAIVDESSNWRELRNLVDTIKEEVNFGRLAGREVWFATDNSTAAYAYHKGSSSSKTLHDMVVELRLLTLEGNFILHLYHIAGTRMIESGVDGLSRGELDIAQLERSISTIMPLNLSPIQRSPALLQWLTSWLDISYQVCQPIDWFYNAQQSRDLETTAVSTTWVWDLPPAAAIHAIEELGLGRLKRHGLLRGVVLIPQLLNYEWFRRFSRVVDVYFYIPAGSISHGTGSKSLLWYRSETRCQRCTALVTHRRGIFCANFGEHVAGLPICQRGWCAKCYKADPGIDFLVFRPSDDNGEEMCAPGEERDFLEGRAGDHLFCPFECDYCSFYRMRGEVPKPDDAADIRLLTFIRRANLDAFWSRRPGTVYNLNNLFTEQVEVGESFSFQMFDSPGPFGTNYDSGIKAAVGILWRSRRPGLHEPTMKYSSVRKARSLHTDLYNASARGVEGAMVWRSDRSRFVSTEAPTDSAWFNRFMVGFKARVGERRKQDAAIPIEVMKALQNSLEEDWAEAVLRDDTAEQLRIAEHGTYYLFLFCGSLRGFEGPKVSLGDLRRQIVRPGSAAAEHTTPHIGLTLVGRFKARSQHTTTILIPVAYRTSSGLKPGVWVERLIGLLAQKNITTGWLFQDEDGDQVKMSRFEDDFYDRLARVHQQTPQIFTEGINISEDFHLARSFRRGATTRATVAGVSGEDIDYINRWNIGSDASIGGPMRILYSDQKQLMDVFLRFSLAL